jgi:hypothetical protein
MIQEAGQNFRLTEKRNETVGRSHMTEMTRAGNLGLQKKKKRIAYLDPGQSSGKMCTQAC